MRSQSVRNGLLGVVVLVLISLNVSGVRAFKPKGHEELERLAYEALDNSHSVPGTTVSGSELLSALIQMEILQEANGTRVVGSGGPDASLERQFNSANQAFHFMASSADVVAASRTQTPKCELLKRALPENVGLMRLLFDETVANPIGAFQAGRGAYVLMHMVGDSFSKEHVERDSGNRLVTVKGWRLLRVFWPNAATRSTQAALDSKPIRDLLHNAPPGGADKDWKYSGTPLRLTLEGHRAVEAIRDLLVSLYLARTAWDATIAPKLPSSYEPIWTAFVTKHYDNACALGGMESVERAHPDDVDAFPGVLVGVGPGWSFSGNPSKLIGQLTVEGHVVPYRATGVLSRLMPGGALVARTPLTERDQIDPTHKWFRGMEATIVGGASTHAPWIRWLGFYVGNRSGLRKPGSFGSFASS